jgi:hypothetical protein
MAPCSAGGNRTRKQLHPARLLKTDDEAQTGFLDGRGLYFRS